MPYSGRYPSQPGEVGEYIHIIVVIAHRLVALNECCKNKNPDQVSASIDARPADPFGRTSFLSMTNTSNIVTFPPTAPSLEKRERVKTLLRCNLR